MSKKWTYELNTMSDIWRGGIYDSREEAIREATNEALIEFTFLIVNLKL